MKPITLLFLSFVLLAGCRGPRYAANNVVQGSIPADITNPKYVLLVQIENHTHRRLLEKAMKKYYPAAYEIVIEEQVKSDRKYDDVDKYRYLVTERYASGGAYQTVYAAGAPHTAGPSYVAYSDQTVYDRKEKKGFPATNLMGHNQAQGMMLFSQAIKK